MALAAVALALAGLGIGAVLAWPSSSNDETPSVVRPPLLDPPPVTFAIRMHVISERWMVNPWLGGPVCKRLGDTMFAPRCDTEDVFALRNYELVVDYLAAITNDSHDMATIEDACRHAQVDVARNPLCT